MRLGYLQFYNRLFYIIIGFNEAEAHAPRIRAQPSALDGTACPASMRPRRMRLGYDLRVFIKNHLTKRFNEAEAHAPRIRVVAARWLIIRCCASMRPRRMRLGYSRKNRR